MKIIEPCCAPRHLKELRNAIGKDGSAEFRGYGDLSLAELLQALMACYDNTEMVIAAPSLPDQAAEAVARWMKVQWPRMDGKGKVYAIRRLTVIADLAAGQSPEASLWLKDNPFGDRLTLVDRAQADTAILLPDFAITGPVNMRYGKEFTATATTNPDTVASLWEKFSKAAEETGAAEKPEPKRKSGRKAKESPAGPAVQDGAPEGAV